MVLNPLKKLFGPKGVEAPQAPAELSKEDEIQQLLESNKNVFIKGPSKESSEIIDSYARKYSASYQKMDRIRCEKGLLPFEIFNILAEREKQGVIFDKKYFKRAWQAFVISKGGLLYDLASFLEIRKGSIERDTLASLIDGIIGAIGDFIKNERLTFNVKDGFNYQVQSGFAIAICVRKSLSLVVLMGGSNKINGENVEIIENVANRIENDYGKKIRAWKGSDKDVPIAIKPMLEEMLNDINGSAVDIERKKEETAKIARQFSSLFGNEDKLIIFEDAHNLDPYTLMFLNNVFGKGSFHTRFIFSADMGIKVKGQQKRVLRFIRSIEDKFATVKAPYDKKKYIEEAKALFFIQGQLKKARKGGSSEDIIGNLNVTLGDLAGADLPFETVLEIYDRLLSSSYAIGRTDKIKKYADRLNSEAARFFGATFEEAFGDLMDPASKGTKTVSEGAKLMFMRAFVKYAKALSYFYGFDPDAEDPNKSIKISLRAKKESLQFLNDKKISDKEIFSDLACLFAVMALVLDDAGETKRALTLLDGNLAMFKNGSNTGLANVYHTYAQIAFRQENFEESRKFIGHSIKLVKGNDELSAKFLEFAADVELTYGNKRYYKEIGELEGYKKLERICDEGIRVCERINDRQGLLHFYYVGVKACSVRSGNPEEKEKMLEKATEYIDLAADIKIAKDIELNLLELTAKGMFASRKGDDDQKMMKCFEDAIELAKLEELQEALPSIYFEYAMELYRFRDNTELLNISIEYMEKIMKKQGTGWKREVCKEYIENA